MENQRINVYLSGATLRKLDRLESEIKRERSLTRKNNRSAIISEAVDAFVVARKDAKESAA